jgi:hypothetical protein
MAKKTASTPAAKAKAAPKKAKPAKKAKPVARGPVARVKELHGSKESLAKSIAGALARGEETAEQLADRLKTASNKQLLHLAKVVETVTKKYGSRDKLISSLSAALGKAKDSDFVTKLKSLPLPRLLDLASAHERRTKHAA